MSMHRSNGTYRYLQQLIAKVLSYPNEMRQSAREGEQYDIDNMILTDPIRALNYFWFEYLLCVIYSFSCTIVTILFFSHEHERLYIEKFAFLYYWLIIGIPLHIGNILIKSFILIRLYKVPLSQAQTIIVRRLMLLVRSHVYLWNERASFLMYNFHVLGMCKLACSNICGSMKNNVYRLAQFMICCFLLRLGNLFVRFLLEYFYLTHTVHFECIINHGASMEEIAKIPVEEYSQDLFPIDNTNKQWCGICLEYFKPGNQIKKLPCAKQHYFHKKCTEKWLRRQNVCPYCRTNLRKAK